MMNNELNNNFNQSTANQINALDEIADNVAIKSDEEIGRLIQETEETLTALMNELKKRQESEMHKAIDNLDEHMANADTSFKALRDFIAMALHELRGK